MKKIFLLAILFFSFDHLFAQQEVFVKSGEAIRGYDVVAYFKDSKPVKGKDGYMFIWKDAIWKFSNEENLKEFKADPAKYAPQFGGYCAYGVSDGSGHKAPTDPAAWTIIDGKLYLNYSLDVRARWNEKRHERIENAIKNWPAVKLERD